MPDIIFLEISRDGDAYEDVQISVEDEMPGFFMELWAAAPELYTVAIVSPTGEQLPRVVVRAGLSQRYRFVFEGTTVSVDYRIETKETASLLIFIRFVNPVKGLWTVRVYPQNVVTGNYNMWLPMEELLADGCFLSARIRTLRSRRREAPVRLSCARMISGREPQYLCGVRAGISGDRRSQAGFCGTGGRSVRSRYPWKLHPLHGDERGVCDHSGGGGADYGVGDRGAE